MSDRPGGRIGAVRRMTMGWIIFWIVGVLISTLGLIASVNSVRFSRRVARDVEAMWRGAAQSPPIDSSKLQHLPDPVQRYLQKALAGRERGVRTARILQSGTFRPKLDGGWLRLRGELYFSASSPGFVWWGRVRMAPGLWVDAHDHSVGGVGNMFVSLESTVVLGNSSGPELDQSALQRLLGELAWLPTTYLDARYVTWAAINEQRARATLRVNGREAVGVFEFGNDALPVRFLAERYRDIGGGKAVLTPFIGEYGDFRHVDGVLVPHQVNGYWILDGERVPFARFRVESLEYDTTVHTEEDRWTRRIPSLAQRRLPSRS
jgi:hypothetical protein